MIRLLEHYSRQKAGDLAAAFVVTAALAAFARAADFEKKSIYPEHLCDALPKAEMSAAMRDALVQYAPELAAAPMVEFAEPAVKAALDKAVADKWSSLFIFTHADLRGDCAVLLSGETLRAVDAGYELHLLTPLSGRDTGGAPFRANWIAIGRGKIVIAYDRDRIRFRHPLYKRIFHLESVVRESIPAFGELDIEGLKGPWGFSVRSLRAVSENSVNVRIGPRTLTKPLRPIEIRK